ncbi:MAG: hypothetical protein ACYDA2_10150, partial [Acidimicrobiales bacterium]
AEGEWVENEAGEMVWQPAEGGEAVSAAEWSRVVAGEPAAAGAEEPKPDETVEAAGAAEAAVATGAVEASGEEAAAEEAEAPTDAVEGAP